MKILLAGAGVNPLDEWLEPFIHGCASGFRGRGHQVMLVLPSTRNSGGNEGVRQYRVWRHPGQRIFPLHSMPFAALASAAFFGWRPDVVVALDSSVAGALFCALSYACRCRYVTFAHAAELAGRGHGHVHSAMMSVFERCQFAVTLSEFTRARLVKFGVPGNRVGVIYPGFEAGQGAADAGAPDVIRTGTIVIGGSGPLVHDSGHDVAIRALPTITERFPSVEYRILGDGPDESKLRALSATLEVEGSVRFLGPRSAVSSEMFFPALDMFVVTAREDGVLAGNEALCGMLGAAASGVPVIGARSGSVPEFIVPDATGLLVDPESPRELARAAIALAGNAEMRRRMGGAAREKAVAQFRLAGQVDLLHEWVARVDTSRA
jgi:glycosyltransferase involved in cell wall biosynthesis